MRAKTTGKLIALAIVGFCNLSAADGVVATIKPLHSLVSFVTAGIAEPHLLIRSAASPHGYALRPSDAGALENARVIFRIDENFEATLSGPDTWPQGPGGITIPCAGRGPVSPSPRRRFRDPRPRSAHRNGRAFALDALIAEVGATLSPVRRKPFIVDATSKTASVWQPPARSLPNVFRVRNASPGFARDCVKSPRCASSVNRGFPRLSSTSRRQLPGQVFSIPSARRRTRTVFLPHPRHGRIVPEVPGVNSRGMRARVGT